jgi:MFS family permease
VLALLCAFAFAQTVSLGAFPALLPEIATGLRLSDVELGAVAGAFGVARMMADLPIGLVVMRHPRWALAGAPVTVALGVLCLSAGGPLGLLVAGRLLMGVGQALGMVGGLTAILRHTAVAQTSASLNLMELCSMIGMLSGNTLVGTLPGRLAWNHALLLACSPLLLAFAVTPWLLAALPRDDKAARALGVAAVAATPSRRASFRVVLAFAAGASIALTYATAEQFVIPLRASRDLGLERAGITRLLMASQTCDILALLPIGLLADRARGPSRVLGAVLVAFAAGSVLVTVGGLTLLAVGCALYGVGMAGWQLPLGIVRAETPPERIAWRTSVYRVFVDSGIFLGPFFAGVLGRRVGMLLPLGLGVLLAAIATALVFIGPGASEPRERPRAEPSGARGRDAPGSRPGDRRSVPWRGTR